MPTKNPDASNLHVLPVPTQQDIKASQLQQLYDFAEDIERENFTAVAVVGQTSDGRTLMRYAVRKHADMVAAVAMLQHDVMEQVYDERELPA